MSELQTLWLGTANAWECDEMGHMNVRYYLAKAEDALACLVRDRGVAGDVTVAAQHIRYHRETRAGTPLAIRGGVLEGGPGTQAYFEFVSPFDRVVRATLITTLAAALPPGPRVALPAHGAPRGLPDGNARQTATLAEADAAGLREIFRGVIRREQLDEAGMLRPHQVIGMVSDGVAHLMMDITPERGLRAREGGLGGAALEQRIIFRAPARLGDQITIRSGIMSAQEKTIRYCHWLLNRHTGEAVATCEVVAVAFDLSARKAVALPAEARARIASIAVGVGA
jgi:acyl-CoA thioester hydrolase